MPQPSMIIPIVIVGILVGSILVSKDTKITRKRLLYASLLSGVLNTAYGYLLYQIYPPRTFTPRAGTTFTGGGTFAGGGTFTGGGAASGAQLEFLVGSFLAGFLVVLVTIGIALVYARYRKRSTTEETEESEQPEESEDVGSEKPPK